MSVSVTVNDIRSSDGTFYVSLYNSEEGLRTRTPIKSKSLKIVENSIVATFKNVSKESMLLVVFMMKMTIN
jgi:uncharacterized protein (DUF2141 family)